MRQSDEWRLLDSRSSGVRFLLSGIFLMPYKFPKTLLGAVVSLEPVPLICSIVPCWMIHAFLVTDAANSSGSHCQAWDALNHKEKTIFIRFVWFIFQKSDRPIRGQEEQGVNRVKNVLFGNKMLRRVFFGSAQSLPLFFFVLPRKITTNSRRFFFKDFLS